MRVEITKIEAIIINASTAEREQFLIPVWKVGYKVTLYEKDIFWSVISEDDHLCKVSTLEGELSWKDDQINTGKMIEYIKNLFRT